MNTACDLRMRLKIILSLGWSLLTLYEATLLPSALVTCTIIIGTGRYVKGVYSGY